MMRWNRWTGAVVVMSAIALSGCRPRVEGPPSRQDSDWDGFIDRYDECPGKMENFNGFRDDDGCPDEPPEGAAKVAVIGSQIRIATGIKFKSGKDIILPQSFDVLGEVARILSEQQKMELRIEGHTDSQGADPQNLALSRRRAEAVVKYLVKQGIDQERLEFIGYGEGRPIDTNDTEEGRNNNRRVEFHIVAR